MNDAHWALLLWKVETMAAAERKRHHVVHPVRKRSVRATGLRPGRRMADFFKRAVLSPR